MIFILEISDRNVDCWSRTDEADVIKVHNILASVFGRESVTSFDAALVGFSIMEGRCEVRVFRGLEEASAAAMCETDPQVRYCLDTEIGIVRRAMARA